MNEEELKTEMVAITRELFEAGLMTPTGGNLSARLPGRKDFWITPSRIHKGRLSPRDLVKLNMEGKRLQGMREPSVEFRLHSSLYRVRPEVQAVIHCHAPLSTALIVSGVKIPPVVAEAVTLVDLPIIPFHLGGTPDLAQAVAQGIGAAPAALLQNHGIISVGETLRQAADTAWSLEHVAKILLACKILGREPTLLSEADVEFIKQYTGAL